MNRISLFLNVVDSRYTPGYYLINRHHSLSSLPPNIKEQIQEGFAQYLAITIRKFLKQSIKEQRYRGRWIPLSPGYLEFKRKHNLSENIWEATGELVDSISYRRYGNQYIIGIDPKKTYPNGANMLEVAQIMEYGGKHMPARPLFTPVFNYVKRHINEYWNDYLLNIDKYLHL